MAWEEFAAAGASLMNSIIGTSASQNLNSENRQWQEKMSAVNYERQKELLQLAPQLQKSGLVQAGMSPAALGNYSGPSANVQTSPPPSASTNSPYVGLDVSSAVNAYLAGKQGELMDSEVRKNDADKKLKDVQSGRYNELTDATINEIKSRTGLNESSAKKVAAEIPLLNSQNEFINWQATQAALDYQKAEATYQSDIDRIKTENKCSEKEAQIRYEMAKDVADAQLALIRAQTYNARASGQSQLSNAYTNRLQYQLDKALNSYLQTYYKESAGKLHEESVSESTLRDSQLKILENDATIKGLQADLLGLDKANYDLDHTIDNASKIIGAGSSLLGAGASVSNASTNARNAATNARNAAINARNAATNERNAATRERNSKRRRSG